MTTPTPAERDILRLLADGLTVGSVAKARGVSRHTVHGQLAAMRIKWNCRNNAQLVAMAVRRGWIE